MLLENITLGLLSLGYSLAGVHGDLCQHTKKYLSYRTSCVHSFRKSFILPIGVFSEGNHDVVGLTLASRLPFTRMQLRVFALVLWVLFLLNSNRLPSLGLSSDLLMSTLQMFLHSLTFPYMRHCCNLGLMALLITPHFLEIDSSIIYTRGRHCIPF